MLINYLLHVILNNVSSLQTTRLQTKSDEKILQSFALETHWSTIKPIVIQMLRHLIGRGQLSILPCGPTHAHHTACSVSEICAALSAIFTLKIHFWLVYLWFDAEDSFECEDPQPWWSWGLRTQRTMLPACCQWFASFHLCDGDGVESGGQISLSDYGL